MPTKVLSRRTILTFLQRFCVTLSRFELISSVTANFGPVEVVPQNPLFTNAFSYSILNRTLPNERKKRTEYRGNMPLGRPAASPDRTRARNGDQTSGEKLFSYFT